MTDTANKPAFNATRRQFAGMGAVAAAAAATGLSVSAKAAPLAVAERALGTSAATLFAPELGEHPGLVMFASPAASRSANAAVAKDLAAQGWAVMLVDAPRGDVQQINLAAKAHAAVLEGQAGVAKDAAGYSLRSFDSGQSSLGKRAAVARGAALFALPVGTAKSAARRDSLHGAARSLQLRAA